jgi:hypothetical protein
MSRKSPDRGRFIMMIFLFGNIAHPSPMRV